MHRAAVAATAAATVGANERARKAGQAGSIADTRAPTSYEPEPHQSRLVFRKRARMHARTHAGMYARTHARTHARTRALCCRAFQMAMTRSAVSAEPDLVNGRTTFVTTR